MGTWKSKPATQQNHYRYHPLTLYPDYLCSTYSAVFFHTIIHPLFNHVILLHNPSVFFSSSIPPHTHIRIQINNYYDQFISNLWVVSAALRFPATSRPHIPFHGSPESEQFGGTLIRNTSELITELGHRVPYLYVLTLFIFTIYERSSVLRSSLNGTPGVKRVWPTVGCILQ